MKYCVMPSAFLPDAYVSRQSLPIATSKPIKTPLIRLYWPAKLALFVYVSTHCVETVKQLYYNRYSQLTRWCSDNASALGARGPGFNSRPRQGFLCCFCFVVGFYFFCPKTHYLSQQFAILYTMLIYEVFLTCWKFCD